MNPQKLVRIAIVVYVVNITAAWQLFFLGYQTAAAIVVSIGTIIIWWIVWKLS